MAHNQMILFVDVYSLMRFFASFLLCGSCLFCLGSHTLDAKKHDGPVVLDAADAFSRKTQTYLKTKGTGLLTSKDLQESVRSMQNMQLPETFPETLAFFRDIVNNPNKWQPLNVEKDLFPKTHALPTFLNALHAHVAQGDCTSWDDVFTASFNLLGSKDLDARQNELNNILKGAQDALNESKIAEAIDYIENTAFGIDVFEQAVQATFLGMEIAKRNLKEVNAFISNHVLIPEDAKNTLTKQLQEALESLNKRKNALQGDRKEHEKLIATWRTFLASCNANKDIQAYLAQKEAEQRAAQESWEKAEKDAQRRQQEEEEARKAAEIEKNLEDGTLATLAQKETEESLHQEIENLLASHEHGYTHRVNSENVMPEVQENLRILFHVLYRKKYTETEKIYRHENNLSTSYYLQDKHLKEIEQRTKSAVTEQLKMVEEQAITRLLNKTFVSCNRHNNGQENLREKAENKIKQFDPSHMSERDWPGVDIEINRLILNNDDTKEKLAQKQTLYKNSLYLKDAQAKLKTNEKAHFWAHNNVACAQAIWNLKEILKDIWGANKEEAKNKAQVALRTLQGILHLDDRGARFDTLQACQEYLNEEEARNANVHNAAPAV